MTTADEVASTSRGRRGTAVSGTDTMITSGAPAACSADTAVAPISAANVAREAGPREFDSNTWWPSADSCLASVPPMFPEPIMPTSIATFRGFVRIHPIPSRQAHDACTLRLVDATPQLLLESLPPG